jgi:hypothetical protein
MGRSFSGLLAVLLLAFGATGCRNCCCLDHYGAVVDHVKDYPILFDTWYCARRDVSRGGKPDWCGPVNRLVACRRCDCVPEWTRYDEVWLYPPRHPYLYPGAAYPGPSQSAEDVEFRDAYESETIRLPAELVPPPAPIPEPPNGE